MRANQLVAAHIKALPATDYLHTSVITEGELLFGASRAPQPRREGLLTAVRQFLADLASVLAVTRDVAAVYGDLKQAVEASGTMIPDNDLWIAGVAASKGLTLVAHDMHFTRIPGLRLEDWLA